MFHMSMEGEGKSHAIVRVVCLTQDELDGHQPNTVCHMVALAKSHDNHMTLLYYYRLHLRITQRLDLISTTTSPFIPKMGATCKLKIDLNISMYIYSLSLSLSLPPSLLSLP